MSSPRSEDQTPQNVAETATRRNALPAGGTVLIGIYGDQNAPEALVRTGSGRIRRIQIGSKVAAARVVAIDANGLVLERGGKTQRLAIPGG